TVDHAQERLAEGRAPAAHRPHVALTGHCWPVGVRVVEADDVLVPLLARQHPATVEAHPGALAGDTLCTTAIPDLAAAQAEQCPALLDYSRRGGCTCQYCSSSMPWFSAPTRGTPPCPCASRTTPTRLCRSKFASSPLRQMPATCTDRSPLATTDTCRTP